MNNKLVIKGENAQDEKILIAMELIAEENKVRLLTFPDAIVTDAFFDQMKNDWRKGKEVELLEHTEQFRDLTASDDFLPEDIKISAGDSDFIERKKLEWQVLVLSAKMHAQFKSELESIKDRVERLDTFDSGEWENLKTFWAKVQHQIKEGILTRGYANDLRKSSDELFNRMKELRKKVDEQYREKAKENFDWFSTQLDGIEKKIEEGLKLSGVFDELKGLQRKFHNTKFTKEFREKVWKRMDGNFKAVKEKRFGKSATANDNSALGRLNNRYQGLLKAIQRSEYSRDRDLKDLKFERKRIAQTDGQLEAQIREAKIKMIEQRLKFKEEKLVDMNKTKVQLETKMAKLKEREEIEKARKEKEAAAKAKIQEEVKQADSIDEATKEKLSAAADKINASKKKSEKSFIDKAMDTVEEAVELIKEEVEDAVISAKAAAVVLSDEITERVEPIVEKGQEKFKEAEEVIDDKVENAKEAFSSENLKETQEELAAKIKERASAIQEDIDKEKKKESGFLHTIMEVVDDIKEGVENAVEEVTEMIEPITEKGKEVVDDLVDKAEETVDKVKDDIKK